MAPSAHIRALVAEAAARMDRRQPAIARNMSDLIGREVEHLDADTALLELMHASTDANVKTLMHILVNGIPIEHLQPTTAAVEYALRLAQRDIPANSLVRAYSVGKDDFIEQIFPDVQALDCSAEDKFEVLHHMSSIVSHYVDWVSQYVFDVYEQERQRWTNARGSVHASLVHDILANRGVPPREFEAETEYKLDLYHLALIIWSGDDLAAADQLRPLQQAVRKLATLAGCVAPPLVTAVDRGTAWAWLPFAAKPHPVEMGVVRAVAAEVASCRLTLGLPAFGAAGFRRSHAQAQSARTVAIAAAAAGRPVGQVVSFGDDNVAMTSLLARDLDSTRAWVAEVLGSLAIDNESSAMLRETLRVFFLTGENYTDTAQQLRLHRNTVKYRVRKALDDCNPPLTANRVDLAVALNGCHFLGAAVLQAAAGR